MTMCPEARVVSEWHVAAHRAETFHIENARPSNAQPANLSSCQTAITRTLTLCWSLGLSSDLADVCTHLPMTSRAQCLVTVSVLETSRDGRHGAQCKVPDSMSNFGHRQSSIGVRIWGTLGDMDAHNKGPL